jgi:hypothetical protein
VQSIFNLFMYAVLHIALATTSASAADFRFVGTESYVSLRMQGPIEPGDFDRMLVELSQADNGRAGYSFFKDRQRLWVNSPGGNVDEALKIAAFVRKSLIPVWVLDRCDSACFLILAAAVDRSLTGKIGIHRPYFGDENSLNLGVEESQRRYAQMSARYYGLLEEFEVPRQIIDRMRSMASTEVHYLTQAERELMGERQPWFEQLLISKCGLDKEREAAMLEEIYRRAPKDPQWRTPADYQAYKKRVKECTIALTYSVGRDAYLSEAEALARRYEASTPARR